MASPDDDGRRVGAEERAVKVRTGNSKKCETCETALCRRLRFPRRHQLSIYREWGSGAAVAVWDARQRLTVGLIGAYA